MTEYDFDKVEELTDWGKIYYFNSDCCHFCLYIYDDDKLTSYLSNVHVNIEERGKGLGDEILNVACIISSAMGANRILLKCAIDSFVHDWYYRHGFKDLVQEKEYVWMAKELKD